MLTGNILPPGREIHFFPRMTLGGSSEGGNLALLRYHELDCAPQQQRGDAVFAIFGEDGHIINGTCTIQMVVESIRFNGRKNYAYNLLFLRIFGDLHFFRRSLWATEISPYNRLRGSFEPGRMTETPIEHLGKLIFVSLAIIPILYLKQI